MIVADLQAEKAETVAAELRALGAEALALDVNVASEQSVQRLAERTFERFGRVDILVNDAGVYLKAPVVSKSEEDWDRTLDVNLGGNFLCARAFVPAMRRQKSGRIISIASSIAHNGAREFADYAASKAAIIGFVKALAREARSRRDHRQRDLSRLGQHRYAAAASLGRGNDGASARDTARPCLGA